MSLLARRRKMARKIKTRDALWQSLQNRSSIDKLFVGATSLADVIELLATTWVSTQPEDTDQEVPLPEALHQGLAHCLGALEAKQELTQSEYLLVSVAKVVIKDDVGWTANSDTQRKAIAELCESIGVQLCQRRRSGMNMLSPGSHPKT